jgi:hypothetical protein
VTTLKESSLPAAAFEEHPEREPLVTNHSPTFNKLIPKVPSDLVDRMKEIYSFLRQGMAAAGRQKLPSADWELQLQRREIHYLQGLKHEELIQ